MQHVKHGIPHLNTATQALAGRTWREVHLLQPHLPPEREQDQYGEQRQEHLHVLPLRLQTLLEMHEGRYLHQIGPPTRANPATSTYRSIACVLDKEEMADGMGQKQTRSDR